MTTPIDEKGRPIYPTQDQTTINRHSSDDDGTVVNDPTSATSARVPFPPIETDRKTSHLTVDTKNHHDEPLRSMASPSQAREQNKRLEDDLTMLEIERQVSQKAREEEEDGTGGTMHRSRSRRPDVIDEFETATNPLHEKAAIYKPPEHPTTSLSKLAKKIHGSNVLIRYFCYITPLALIILCPILLGFYRYRDSYVGGVQMRWFCIWLMIVWLSLWAGRLIASALPWPMALISSLFTNNSKKWRDMFKQLEVPATIFFWTLAIEISYLPTMRSHARPGADLGWTETMNKILIVLLVGATLGFISKILIQLIAISFHLRTYDDRIQINKFQINSLAKLYTFSKEKITMDDSDFEEESGTKSGARTPGQILEKAQKGTKEAMRKFGDVTGKVAGDFTGKKVTDSSHPNQVVLQLLSTTGGSQVLARRLYRTFYRPETETVHSDDLKNAFDNEEEADAAFQMFDKDLNGDISMEELEAVCVEIGRERKAITASLKDLDSVVSKLDDVFIFIVCVVAVLVFISLISTSAAGVLTSAGSAVLALSWLFSATAQEFLQSIIFVFVKHPFDVGDRVGIYGNTGALGKGDDYFVKEIALLYTEFKKMEGHIVQAPNSYLNTLFILNQRRSGGLAEAVPIIIKFGTTLEQIEQLRSRLLDFVTAEKREYQTNILTELKAVTEAHSLTLNVVFFYKSNWQNELLRLQRRNKFICALMVTMQDLGIEGPRMRYPGQKESFPMYLQSVPHIGTPNMGHGGNPDHPEGIRSDPILADSQDPPFVPPPDGSGINRNPSILKSGSTTRPRGESLAAMGRRVDFSLGMKSISSSDLMGDIYEDRARTKLPSSVSPSGRGSYERGSDRGGSSDIGRSSSVALKRTPTDASVSTKTSHRNRFFGRRRGGDEEMADIPETVTPEARLDPRTGIVSPNAVRDSLERTR